MKKEKELLRQQLALLAKQSKGAVEKDLSELSDSMCEVYKSITQPHAAFFCKPYCGRKSGCMLPNTFQEALQE